jgi:pyruvate/2-oxoglutarate dehydrogenase complex dihydrolipoamide dehydrogenase (E3) component
MSDAESFDGIVIGAGQGGGPLASALAQAGWKIAMVEREHAGGTCINEGCTPTKTMVASARAAYTARRAAEFGVQTGPVTVDMEKIRQRKRDIVTSWQEGSRRRIEDTDGVTYIDGEARFIGPKTIEVALNAGGTRRLSAEHIFINTGQRARTVPLDGLDDVPFLTNLSLMELEAVPERLMVLGGGYIGLEFGQMFQRFGAQVTILEASDRFLPREDADTGQAVRQILEEEGVHIETGVSARSIRYHAGEFALEADTPGGEKTFQADQFLLSAGRTPNTDKLNLSAAGVETDKRGYIQVNDRLETNVPGIYAIGDVTGGPAFTHISYDDFRVLRANLIDGGNATVRDRQVPYTVFIDPQLAHVGLHESEARDQGLNIRVARMPFDYIARASEIQEPRGFLKAIVDADTDQILGVTILGYEGGELLALFQVAMLGGVPYQALRDAVFAHPTLAEGVNNLFIYWQDD